MMFDFYGLYNGVLAMMDRESQSVWLQVGGKAIKGAMVGKTLKTGPLLDTTWRRWKQLHPDTLVMAPVESARKQYDRKGIIVERGFDSFPARYFNRSITHRDKRLATHEMVMAVCVKKPDVEEAPDGIVQRRPGGTVYRAYPLKSFNGVSGVINDSSDVPVAVFYEAGTATCSAHSRELDGVALTFECRKSPDGIPAFFDKETGSRWSIEGEAKAGPLAGKRLTRLDGTMSEWYGWVSFFPQTTIFGQAAVAGTHN